MIKKGRGPDGFHVYQVSLQDIVVMNVVLLLCMTCAGLCVHKSSGVEYI